MSPVTFAVRGPIAIPAGGPPPTTWNLLDKSSFVSLSPDNLTATGSRANYDNVRAVASASSGKRFSQHTLNTNPSGDIILIGIANFGSTLDNNPSGLNDANAATCDVSNGNMFCNGVPGNIGIAGTIGDVISYAVDLTAKLVWYRINSLDWNNNASADPATGTLGFDISAIAAGPWFQVVALHDNPTSITSNFGGTSYSPPAPGGFGNW